CPRQKLIDSVLRELTGPAQIAPDDLERKVLLDMHRGSLEPGGEVVALIGREASAAHHEPICRILGNEAAHLLFPCTHKLTAVAPCDAGNAPSPGSGTS